MASWLAPTGVVVGVLAAVPVILASFWDDARRVLLTFAMAAGGSVLVTAFGPEAAASESSRILNPTLVLFTLGSSAALAVLLQRRRLDVVRARDAAVSASETSRLLRSLLAHDLRAPLTVSSQAFEYVEDALADGRPIDRDLLADVRARLRRSLRAIDIVLDIARTEVPGSGSTSSSRDVDIHGEIEAEAASFTHEAEVRGKRLVTELDPLDGALYTIDAPVLRQALAILLDNAIRHAAPGIILVSAEAAATGLAVRVRDSGPGFSATQRVGSSAAGSGLGLRLCRSLAARAGGSLSIERDGPDGTGFLLRLPATPAIAACGMQIGRRTSSPPPSSRHR